MQGTEANAEHLPVEHARLAIDGGSPVRSSAWPPWPHFDDEAIEAVSTVLRSGNVSYWTGQEGRRFEQEFAQFVGTDHAVAVANGSVALELALHAVGIGPGDEVIVPARTFVATPGSVVMRGARPVFADVDPDSQNVTAETIEAALTPRTRGIIVVHLAGWPCETGPIVDLARRHGLKLIEDCAQAHGATDDGQMIGSIGDAAAFSFCQNKILTTGGEGGMLTTNDAAVWKRAWSFKDHGKDPRAVESASSASVFRWVHHRVGTNWRLTELQAALGRTFLRRLPEWIETRRRNAQLLADALAPVPALRTPMPAPASRHSFYKFYTFLDLNSLRPGWDRDRVVRAICAEGIPCGSGICPEAYRERCFEAAGLQPEQRLPVARRLGERSLMLQVHPMLSPAEMAETARAVRKVLGHAVAEGPYEHRKAA